MIEKIRVWRQTIQHHSSNQEGISCIFLISQQIHILWVHISSSLRCLTHCRLNELTHTIYWKILISILGTCMWGYVIEIFWKKIGWIICKQWRPWSDTAFCGIWSGSALFANYLLGVSRLQWVNEHPQRIFSWRNKNISTFLVEEICLIWSLIRYSTKDIFTVPFHVFTIAGIYSNPD